jgi:hypothetical protein
MRQNPSISHTTQFSGQELQQSATIYRLYAAPLVKPDQVVFRINGHEGRVILMDEFTDRSVERHRPNFYSQTDLMYNYIVRNPNRVITLDEVRTNIDRRHLSLTFTQLVSGLKFSGKLRRLFFRASKSHLIFYNPITVARMQMLGVAYEDIIPYMTEAIRPTHPTFKPNDWCRGMAEIAA